MAIKIFLPCMAGIKMYISPGLTVSEVYRDINFRDTCRVLITTV